MTKTYLDLLHESNYKSAVCRATENLKHEVISMIKDSGNRRQFYDKDGNPTAVRDMAEGKGRCDLMPLDVVGRIILTHGNCDKVLVAIALFQKNLGIKYLYTALDEFAKTRLWDKATMLLEVAKHFEEGCAKYGADNWRKGSGIPIYSYIDSAVRHYLKWLRGDTDEPHDRAFCWNIICCIWTYEHLEKGGDTDA